MGAKFTVGVAGWNVSPPTLTGVVKVLVLTVRDADVWMPTVLWRDTLTRSLEEKTTRTRELLTTWSTETVRGDANTVAEDWEKPNSGGDNEGELNTTSNWTPLDGT